MRQISFYSQAMLPDNILVFVHTFVLKIRGLLIMVILIVIHVFVNYYHFTCIFILS